MVWACQNSSVCIASNALLRHQLPSQANAYADDVWFAGAEDVSAGVKFAVSKGIPLAVKGGGHSWVSATLCRAPGEMYTQIKHQVPVSQVHIQLAQFAGLMNHTIVQVLAASC